MFASPKQSTRYTAQVSPRKCDKPLQQRSGHRADSTRPSPMAEAVSQAVVAFIMSLPEERRLEVFLRIYLFIMVHVWLAYEVEQWKEQQMACRAVESRLASGSVASVGHTWSVASAVICW